MVYSMPHYGMNEEPTACSASGPGWAPPRIRRATSLGTCPETAATVATAATARGDGRGRRRDGWCRRRGGGWGLLWDFIGFDMGCFFGGKLDDLMAFSGT